VDWDFAIINVQPVYIEFHVELDYERDGSDDAAITGIPVRAGVFSSSDLSGGAREVVIPLVQPLAMTDVTIDGGGNTVNLHKSRHVCFEEYDPQIDALPAYDCDEEESAPEPEPSPPSEEDIIEPRTDDPTSPVDGRIWLRTDL